MIPCCGSSFCDECVRTALLESEDNECPDCKEKGSSPGSLIPNRFLRNSVNSFKNETGYNKPRPSLRAKLSEKKAKPEEIVEPAEEVKTAESSEPKIDFEETTKSESENENEKGKYFYITLLEKFEYNIFMISEENESDYEDNITVTVPPAHLTSHGAYKERHLIGRHGQRLKPPGMDTPPKLQTQLSQQSTSHEERSSTPTIDEKESYHSISSTENNRGLMHPSQQHGHGNSHSLMQHHMDMPPHMQNQNGYGGQGGMHYPQSNAHRSYEGNDYNMMSYGSYPPRSYDQMGGGGYRMKGPYMGPRMPYGPMHGQMNMRGPRPLMGQPNLAQVFQGVQAKVGPGIIDDPLEAFNRLMREKERRQGERRRSPHMEHRRRSRSHDGDRRRSPMERDRRRQSRNRTPDRRIRTSEDRRGRSHIRESEDREKKRRSSSYSRSCSRSSRSFSRSPMRKRSRSPGQRKWSRSPQQHRRSRSRSPSFTFNRYYLHFISLFIIIIINIFFLFFCSFNRRDQRRDGPRDFEFRERSPFYQG